MPWNEVWRTGADAATGFTTSRDLTIGTVAVPAGSYTLYTLPAPGGWQLIVNKQTKQWGTQYDAAQDLARILLREPRMNAGHGYDNCNYREPRISADEHGYGSQRGSRPHQAGNVVGFSSSFLLVFGTCS